MLFITKNCFPSIRFTFNKILEEDAADKGEKYQEAGVENGKKVW